MPRDVNGNYTLPSGNPVVTNTLISSIWANTTLSDVATGLSNSLDRTGASAGMTGQFKSTDGAIGAPGISFNSEPASGLYRAGAADFRFSIAATDRVTFGANGLGATLVRAGDGAIGGPSFSWTSESSSGWYKGGANDFRFSISSTDVFKITPTSILGIQAVTAPAFIVNGATVPTNGFYLPAANSIGWATNSTVRGSVNANGTMGLSNVGTNPGLDLNSNNTAVGNPLLRLLNANASGQTMIDFFSNGILNSRLRSDFAGNLNYASFLSGAHNFFVGGDSGTGANTFQIVTAANGGAVVADSAGALIVVGFRDIPQISQTVNFTCDASYRGKQVLMTIPGTVGTIPSNASVPYPIGTAIVFVAGIASGTLSIAINSDTLQLGGTLTSGTRTLGPGGIATALKVAATVWYISGPGLS